MNIGFKYIILASLTFFQYTLFCQIPTNGLSAYYPFNGNANDESGNGNSSVIIGATLTTDRCDNENSAYLFNGISDYIKLTSSLALNTENSFSIVAWINNYRITSDGKYNDNAIFGQTDGSSGNDYPIIAFEVKADTTVRGMIRGTSNPALDIQTQSGLNNHTWYQVALVRNAPQDSLSIYINGELAMKGGASLIGNTATNDFVSLGAYYDDLQTVFHFFCGKIDDVLIYKRSLTDEEIKGLYTTGCNEFSLHGETTVCKGDQNEYYVISNIEITNYEWNYSGMGANVIGDSDSISIYFSDDATSGTLSVTVFWDSNGQETIELPIMVYPLPDTAGNITGDVHVCPNQEELSYSVPLINFASEYQWSYSGQGASISGSGNSVNVGFMSDAVSGTLFVAGQNLCGVGEASGLLINIDSLPSTIGIIQGENTVCRDYPYTFRIEPATGGQNYYWQYSESGAEITSNYDSASISFSEEGSGNLKVYEENSCGRGETSQPFPVIVNACEINIPNSFTPNEDGINDIFYIRNLPEGTKLVIFNRLGKELYRSDNYQNNWNGTDNEGNILDTETYWYIIVVPGIVKEFSGFVYLKR